LGAGFGHATLAGMAQERVAAQQRDYPQLLSLAVHELRSPASVVRGYLRMLQQIDPESPLSDHQKKLVTEAERSCARIVTLISELSEVAKLDAGTATVNEGTFDLFSRLANVAALVHEAEDRGVRLVMAGEPAGAPMFGDTVRIDAAFQAFFRAILREQPASCTVVVDRRRIPTEAGNSAVVIIAESSVVLQAYNAHRAGFDDTRGGLGLALPIAGRVIERHHGAVWSPALPNVPAIIVSLPIGEKQG
jgi:signal transduction histidine kinase